MSANPPVPVDHLPGVVKYDEKNGSNLPAHIREAMSKGSGIGWVTPADLVFPRLIVVSSSSKIAKERGPDNKPLCNEGDLWHKQNQRVYAPFGGSVRVIPVACQREYLHWHPRDSNKGLAEKTTDPKSPLAIQCQQAAEMAKRGELKKDDSKPTFVESHAWLFWDLHRNEAYVLSFKGGNIAESQAVISALTMKKVPLYGYVFDLVTFMKNARPPNPKFPAVNFKQYGWASVEMFQHFEKVAKDLGGKDFSAPEDEPLTEEAPVHSGTAESEIN